MAMQDVPVYTKLFEEKDIECVPSRSWNLCFDTNIKDKYIRPAGSYKFFKQQHGIDVSILYHVMHVQGDPIILVSNSTKEPLLSVHLETIKTVVDPSTPPPGALFYRKKQADPNPNNPKATNEFYGLVNQVKAPFRLVVTNLTTKTPLAVNIHKADTEEKGPIVNEVQLIHPLRSMICSADNTVKTHPQLILDHEEEKTTEGRIAPLTMQANEAKPKDQQKKGVGFRIHVYGVMKDDKSQMEELLMKDTHWVTRNQLPYLIYTEKHQLIPKGLSRGASANERDRSRDVPSFTFSSAAPQPQSINSWGASNLGSTGFGSSSREDRDGARDRPFREHGTFNFSFGGGGRHPKSRSFGTGPLSTYEGVLESYTKPKEKDDSEDEESFSMASVDEDDEDDEGATVSANAIIAQKQAAARGMAMGMTSTIQSANREADASQHIQSAYVGKLGHGAEQLRNSQKSDYEFDWSRQTVVAHVTLGIQPNLQFIESFLRPLQPFSFHTSQTKDEAAETAKKRRILWLVGSTLPLWQYRPEEFDPDFKAKQEKKEASGHSYFVSDNCILCLEALPTLIFLPCRHQCVHIPDTAGCSLTLDTLRTLKECYLCRGPVSSYVIASSLAKTEVN